MPIVEYPFEAKCAYCHLPLKFDIDTDGTLGRNGDWHYDDDYGCDNSPLNTDEATGGHRPIDIVWTAED